MIVSWSYKERDTIIQRLDPRARIMFMLCAIFAIIQTWDLRWLLGWLAVAGTAYVLARLTWGETKRFWLVVLPIITLLVTVTAITGRGGVEAYQVEHIIFEHRLVVPLLGERIFDISAEQLMYALSQFIRMLCMATFGLLIPFTTHPGEYGITFRGLGMNDKFAVATDLAFRLVPTVGQDFQITLDAQKARGYELERLGGSLIQQIRNLAPLIIPVTIGTIVGGEEIIDAMDLRAFGASKQRTWVTQLVYEQRDFILIGAGVSVLLLTTIANIAGYGSLWIPQIVLPTG